MANSRTVRHDAFARGGFARTCHGPGECAWCGQKRTRVYSYVWVSDGALDGQPRIFVRHQADQVFCNFDCFESYHS
jgi:hypothetical protein